MGKAAAASLTKEQVRAHIEATCRPLKVARDGDSVFFQHDHGPSPTPAQQIPWATITTSDKYDPGSDLEARGLWRLNLGVGVGEYGKRFGKPPAFPKDGGIVPGIDYTRLDVLMPHPVYAAMGWVCIVAPTQASWEELKALIAEAFVQKAAW